MTESTKAETFGGALTSLGERMSRGFALALAARGVREMKMRLTVEALTQANERRRELLTRAEEVTAEARSFVRSFPETYPEFTRFAARRSPADREQEDGVNVTQGREQYTSGQGRASRTEAQNVTEER